MNKHYAEETSFNETDVEYLEQNTNIKHSSITQDESRDVIPLTQNTEDSGENKYCLFKYYFEAKRMQSDEDKKNNNVSDGCSDFRRAIMDKLDDIIDIDRTIDSIREGTFNRFIFTQKHVGESAFLSMLSRRLKEQYRFDYTYVCFWKPQYLKPDNDFNQLKIFIQNYDINTENIIKFLDSLIEEHKLKSRENELTRGKFQNKDIINIDEIEPLIKKAVEGFNKKAENLYLVREFNESVENADFLSLKKEFLIYKNNILTNIEQQVIIDSSEKNLINETSQKRHLVFIDSIDKAFCEMFKNDGVSLKVIKQARRNWISAIKIINQNCSSYLKTCVVSLRKRKVDSNENTKNSREHTEGISLRGEWKYNSSFYSGIFFAELLRVIENEKPRFDKNDQQVHIDHYQYTITNTDCYRQNKMGEKQFCRFALDKQDLTRIIGEKGVDKIFEEKSFKKFVKLCEGNPYFIVRPMIEALTFNKEVGNGCDVDRNIKQFFKQLWQKLNDEDIFSRFANFMETLPLYLPDEICWQKFKEIHNCAIICFEEMIDYALKHEGLLYPTISINKLIENDKIEKYDDVIYKSILETLEDNCAINLVGVPEVNGKGGVLSYYMKSFRLHPFIKYVFDTNEKYFKRF